ncbi:helix-turn-helix transcriptional regulator [uncultured Aquabacterium sp.]|jgi:DNA-binding NarL/FixJ family response regulator|uniref:helix-turn-helix domain-containing protein n=1 Tax=uncultured Aquabacterium sp. TaxID=158753 RepID=UPI0026277D48|nr:helix-turn-helix transcriptional regulator [uncultured Aquabacterium sp.]
MPASSNQLGVPGGAGAGAALTPRQFAVGALVAQGLTNAEVAERLGLSVATVKVYRREAMQRLGAASPVQLVRHFLGVPASAAPGMGARLVRPLQAHVVDTDATARRGLLQALRRRGIPAQEHAGVAALLHEGAPAATDVVLMSLCPPAFAWDERAFEPAGALRRASDCGLLLLLPSYHMGHWTAAREAGADGVFSRPVDFRELHLAVMNLYARLGHGASVDVDSPSWPARPPMSAKPQPLNGSRLMA